MPPRPGEGDSSGNAAARGKHDLEKLRTLLPIPYVKGPAHTRSTGTRHPTFYDLHLHKELQLRTVEYSPHITTLFCDMYNHNRPREFASKGQDLNFEAIYTEWAERPGIINNEDDLVTDYYERTGRICTQLASAVIRNMYARRGAIGPKDASRFDTIMKWEGTTTTRNSAVGDLYLKPNLTTGKTKMFIPRDEYNDLPVNELLKMDVEVCNRNDIFTWVIMEGKSLVAGSTELMEAISRYGRGERTFTWMECGTQHFGMPAFSCNPSNPSVPGDRHFNAAGEQTQTGHKAGPDCFVKTWWPNPEEPCDTDESSEPSASKHRRGQVDYDDYSGWDIKAAYIIQQMWAELVQADATFGLIYSGNHEIFVQRRRATGTLYISEIVEPASNIATPHYILHTGLYVTAFSDARNRAIYLETAFGQLYNAEYLASQEWWDGYIRDYDFDNYEYRHIDTKQRLTSKKMKEISNQRHKEVCAIVKASTMISVTLPRSTDDSARPRLFVKLIDNGPHSKPTAVLNKVPADMIVPKASTPKPFEGSKVWRAYVTAEGISSNDFVIKLASTPETRSALLKDYRMHFARDGTTPCPYTTTSFGLFSTFLQGGTEWYIHITEFVNGDNAAQVLMKKNSGSQKHAKYLQSASAKIEHVVDEFHRTSRRTHRNLRGEHLLLQVGDGAKVEDVKLISFGGARNLSPDKRKEDEEKEDDKSWFRRTGIIKK